MKKILKIVGVAAVLVVGVGVLGIIGIFIEFSRNPSLNEYRFLTTVNHLQSDFLLNYAKNSLIVWAIYLVTIISLILLLLLKRKLPPLGKVFLLLISLLVLVLLFSEITGGVSKSAKFRKMGELLIYRGVKNIEVKSTADGILAFDRAINFTVNKNIDEVLSYYRGNLPDGFTLDNPDEAPLEDPNPNYLNAQIRLLKDDFKGIGEYRIDLDSEKSSVLTRVSLLDLTK